MQLYFEIFISTDCCYYKTIYKVKWFIFSKFGWSSASKIKFNPSGSLLFVSGVCRVIRMGAVEVGEMVVYQVRILYKYIPIKSSNAGEGAQCRQHPEQNQSQVSEVCISHLLF